MPELNFCAFCGASQHKLMLCSQEIFFCRECSQFFKFKERDIRCRRCKGEIRKSDYPSAKGEALFICNKCKRTYTSFELFEK
ncbi:hypothetical protein GF323_01575 [Candidatus Woesearchaeota archaeon]|nr:hypothetical protein [Candidatus Woesearchaeota archaeon]